MAKRKRDYYAVLGLTKSASEADIKRAFRELARQHHPDMAKSGSEDGERFREINEAYATLSDKELRARYDRWGHPDDDGGGLASTIIDTASDIIGNLFRNRGSSAPARSKGGDIRYTIEVTFEEAAFGCERKVSLDGGRELVVVVPPGTKDGQVKTLRSEGEPGKGGGAAGDLHVLIRVAEHSFRREGYDVHASLDITFSQAALGAVLEVPTLDGTVKMRIPEGTQPGRVFRIRGKGIPQSASKTATRGDHLVEVTIAVPTELTPRQRELIEELGRINDEIAAAPPGGRKRLIDRVRSLLDE